MTEHKVIFTPSGIRATADGEQTVYDVALAAGVDLQSICGGKGMCNRCQVEVEPGNHAKYGVTVGENALSDWTESEQRGVDKGRLQAGRRLACRAKVQGDVVVDVPADAREYDTSISKASVAFLTELDPAVTLHMLELPQQGLDDNPSDAEALSAALRQFGIEASPKHRALVKLQPILAKNDRRLIAVVRDDHQVIDVWPPEMFHVYGAAIDIGSTSIALYLYDLSQGELAYEASAMNPQIRFGEDLMSRVSYCMLNKGGEEKLTKAVREQIAAMLEQARATLNLGHNQILEIVAVGNPIMHHLFLGISPVELGQAPFTLAVKELFEIPARLLDLGISESARVTMLPLVGGHVGADTTGAYLTQIDRMDGRSVLLVDIGTNAEIVLSHGGKVAAASSPTGPAFEGAEISAGVRASKGAIERVRIDPATGASKVRIIGHGEWLSDSDGSVLPHRISGICGSGIFEVMVELADAGFIDRGGLFRPQACPARFVADGNSWKFLLVDQPGAQIWVKQTDIRSVQLAKAALAAGVRLLTDHLGCETFDEVLLAGAFGNHLDADYVARIGIIPGAEAAQISSIGNAAGMGAAMAMFNRAEQRKLVEAVRKIEKVETATEPKFQDYFVEAMAFPTAPQTNDENKQGRGRRRRSRDRTA
ncbi:ASKHA domain-containing protein [uncultured Erythrobacter sp.]|uniref:ASKHA domain-containing protein n=1 Tax=uncultured Erythrobacter sp. TaxID=263913 RepID=UPI0026098B09|nr:ASKHA domain-containing protein [uncultured Erythrobacter sp.]